jgi:hypothetical protein
MELDEGAFGEALYHFDHVYRVAPGTPMGKASFRDMRRNPFCTPPRLAFGPELHYSFVET